MFTKKKHLAKMITSFGQHWGDALPLLEKCWRNECSAHAQVTLNLLLKRVSKETIRRLHQQAIKTRKPIRKQKLSATNKVCHHLSPLETAPVEKCPFLRQGLLVCEPHQCQEKSVGAEKENNTKKMALNEEVSMEEGHNVTQCGHFSWMWNGGWLLQMIIVGKWLIAKSWNFGI